jgi:acetylornithine deacetylase
MSFANEDRVTRATPLTSPAMLARLIGFDTTSRNSNLALIDFIRDYLQGWGVASELVSDDSGAKANLIATVGPSERAGLVLSGHTDVVPVDGQDWSSDPFVCTERDGRLYGRGAADMKGFVATVLALVPDFLARPLRVPVHLALSYDEEVGCKGAPRLLDRLGELLPVPPFGAVIGEPTAMRVANAHKGKAGYACVVSGLACHSALNHQGVNALEIAAEIIVRLRRRNLEFRARGPFQEGFDPPHCTVTTSVIGAGTALNIVPDACRFEFEFRTLPGQDPAALLSEVQSFADTELLPEMRARHPEAGIAWQELMSYPALGGAGDTAIERLCCAVAGAACPVKVPFGTEAGLFAARGIPSVVCGPGDMTVAHKPDEHVERIELERCADFLRRLVAQAVAA